MGGYKVGMVAIVSAINAASAKTKAHGDAACVTKSFYDDLTEVVKITPRIDPLKDSRQYPNVFSKKQRRQSRGKGKRS